MRGNKKRRQGETPSKQVTSQLRLKSAFICGGDGQPLGSVKWENVIMPITSLLPPCGEKMEESQVWKQGDQLRDSLLGQGCHKKAREVEMRGVGAYFWREPQGGFLVRCV